MRRMTLAPMVPRCSTPTRRECSVAWDRPGAGRGRDAFRVLAAASRTPDAVRASTSTSLSRVRGGGAGAGVVLLAWATSPTGRRYVRREQAQGDEPPGCRRRHGAWQARSRRCYARRMRPTRPRTPLARRFGAQLPADRAGGRRRRWAAKARLEAAARAADDARGPAGAGPQPEGRRRTSAYGERTRRRTATSRTQLDHEDQQRGVPAPTRRSRRDAEHQLVVAHGSDGEPQCHPGSCRCCSVTVRLREVRPQPCDGAGRRSVLQRAGLDGPGSAGR